MATKKTPSASAAATPGDAPPPNREQRRREKFGHAGGATKAVWPQSEANPAFGHRSTADDGSHSPSDAGQPDQIVDDEGVDIPGSTKA